MIVWFLECVKPYVHFTRYPLDRGALMRWIRLATYGAGVRSIFYQRMASPTPRPQNDHRRFFTETLESADLSMLR